MNLAQKICVLLIKGYQATFSKTIRCCRFYPTCSEYALQAIKAHGAFRGCFLALKRVLKCHPFHEGGVDEVPAVRKGKPNDGIFKTGNLK